MGIFRRIFDFYLRASIHVALAVYALVRMTQHMFHIPYDKPMAYFAFFGTITGYNFVKYDELLRVKKSSRSEVKAFAILSLISFLIAGFCFLNLTLKTQITSFIFLALTALYTLPFFPNRRNARNWSGVKIYIVSLCWVGVTVVLPVIESGIALTSDFYLKCIQRFILVFVLVLIFEIIDLTKDDPHLHTVPQQIGVKRTKILGVLLTVLFFLLEFFRIHTDVFQIAINYILIVLVAGFLIFANPNRHRYYSAFWAESIPIIWWLMIAMSTHFPGC